MKHSIEILVSLSEFSIGMVISYLVEHKDELSNQDLKQINDCILGNADVSKRLEAAMSYYEEASKRSYLADDLEKAVQRRDVEITRQSVEIVRLRKELEEARKPK